MKMVQRYSAEHLEVCTMEYPASEGVYEAEIKEVFDSFAKEYPNRALITALILEGDTYPHSELTRLRRIVETPIRQLWTYGPTYNKDELIRAAKLTFPAYDEDSDPIIEEEPPKKFWMGIDPASGPDFSALRLDYPTDALDAMTDSFRKMGDAMKIPPVMGGLRESLREWEGGGLMSGRMVSRSRDIPLCEDIDVSFMVSHRAEGIPIEEVKRRLCHAIADELFKRGNLRVEATKEMDSPHTPYGSTQYTARVQILIK